eukprot:5430099-Ditylum_brightwellii.AAC.1
MHNLVAVAALCNAGCRVMFDPEEVEVTKEGRQIIRGWRNSKTCFWCIPIIDKVSSPPQKVTEQHTYTNAADQLNTKYYMMYM